MSVEFKSLSHFMHLFDIVCGVLMYWKLKWLKNINNKNSNSDVDDDDDNDNDIDYRNNEEEKTHQSTPPTKIHNKNSCCIYGGYYTYVWMCTQMNNEVSVTQNTQWKITTTEKLLKWANGSWDILLTTLTKTHKHTHTHTQTSNKSK